MIAAAAATVVALTGSAQAASASAPTARPTPGKQLWAASFQADGEGQETAMALSPSGRTVFVTGSSQDSRATGVDYKTVAYSAATGRKLWASRYSGPGKREDDPCAMAVSPGGGTVFVTGYSPSLRGAANGVGAYATIAYSAATGRQLWVSRSDLGGEADSVAVSRAGTTIYVTGRGNGYATIAYRAATGRQLWASTYHGPKHNDGACCVAVNQAGTKVFVSGNSEGRISDLYTTIAYRG